MANKLNRMNRELFFCHKANLLASIETVKTHVQSICNHAQNLYKMIEIRLSITFKFKTRSKQIRSELYHESVVCNPSSLFHIH